MLAMNRTPIVAKKIVTTVLTCGLVVFATAAAAQGFDGTIVVKEGKVLPVKPGQPMCFPVEAEGRFQPVEVNTWLGEHAINVPDMHGMDDPGTGAMLEGRGMARSGGGRADHRGRAGPAVRLTMTR